MEFEESLLEISDTGSNNSLFELGDLLDEDSAGNSIHQESVPTPTPFILEDFQPTQKRKLGFGNVEEKFEDKKVGAQFSKLFNCVDEFDSDFSNDYKLRIFGKDGANFSDVSAANFQTLWKAVLMRDYRVILSKFSRRSKYCSLKYDLTILGTGFIVVVSEGHVNVCPPHARSLFFPSGCHIPAYGFIEDTKLQKVTSLKDRACLEPEMTSALAKLIQNMPLATSRMKIDELLRILEENTKIGKKINPEDIFERSALFVPYYDFTCPYSGLEKQLSERPEFKDLLDLKKRPPFPLSTLAEFNPGMGSLVKDFNQLNANHTPVRWLPISQGTAESLGLQMIHCMITADCGWEFTAGFYKAPHTSVRGIPYLDDIYQKPQQPVNLGNFHYKITAPNKVNIVTDDPIRPYNRLLTIFRCFSDPKTDNRSLTKEIEELFYNNGYDGADITRFAHTLMGLIDDQTIIPRALHGADSETREFLLNIISSTLTSDVIHHRLKLRLKDPNLSVNPYFKVSHHFMISYDHPYYSSIFSQSAA